MPRTPSAVKALRVSERRRLRNRSVRSALRTYVKKARTSVAAGEIKEATDFAKTAVSQLDKAAGKGVVHPNQAARRKSRLMHQLAVARREMEKTAAEEPKAVPTRGRARTAPRAAATPEVADQPKRARATATSTTRTRATPVRAATARKTAPAQEDAPPKPRQTRTRKTSTD